MPWLVVTDFGCCATPKGLWQPFHSEEMSRGGNRALMAPEVINAEPGPFSHINYTSSDLWAVGAIAYELFGGYNPFYPYPGKKSYLQSISYNECELPEKPKSMPLVIQSLVSKILRRNPNEVSRLSLAKTH
jgi:PTEN induced putative kinase 1